MPRHHLQFCVAYSAPSDSILSKQQFPKSCKTYQLPKSKKKVLSSHQWRTFTKNQFIALQRNNFVVVKDWKAKCIVKEHNSQTGQNLDPRTALLVKHNLCKWGRKTYNWDHGKETSSLLSDHIFVNLHVTEYFPNYYYNAICLFCEFDKFQIPI